MGLGFLKTGQFVSFNLAGRAFRGIEPIEENFVNFAELVVGFEQAKPEVVVLGPGRISVAAQLFQHGATNHCRGVGEGAVDKTLSKNGIRRNYGVHPFLVSLVAAVGCYDGFVLSSLHNADEGAASGQVRIVF